MIDSQGRLCIIWSKADVLEVDENLTDEQCAKVLRVLDNEHSADRGINWDVIEATVKRLKRENKL